MNMDAIDRQILRELQKDSAITNVELARRVGHGKALGLDNRLQASRKPQKGAAVALSGDLVVAGRIDGGDSALAGGRAARSEGTEEGNFVGKFLDTHRPPPTCA
mgnify:CR=1 FL=1